jgi:hypothetical protein
VTGVAEVVTGGTDEPTATEGEEMSMRAYRGVLDLLIRATERFYMLSPRCWPLLAGSDCFLSEPPSLDRRLGKLS